MCDNLLSFCAISIFRLYFNILVSLHKGLSTHHVIRLSIKLHDKRFNTKQSKNLIGFQMIFT